MNPTFLILTLLQFSRKQSCLLLYILKKKKKHFSLFFRFVYCCLKMEFRFHILILNKKNRGECKTKLMVDIYIFIQNELEKNGTIGLMNIQGNYVLGYRLKCHALFSIKFIFIFAFPSTHFLPTIEYFFERNFMQKC